MKKGFTLVELIVVVTIIMVITALGVVNFAGINKRSRDSRRISDLKKVSIALEIYRQEVRVYPASVGDLVGDYMDVVPTDPKSSASYPYSRGATTYTYSLYALVEDSSIETAGAPYGGTDCGGGVLCNYRTINP